MALQIGVAKVWGRRSIETEGDLSDYILVAMCGVEDAATVREAALLVSESSEGERFKIKYADVSDGIGNFLAVGSDVLDGCAANATRNTGEAFDAADSLLADFVDEGVPFCAGGCGDIEVIG